MAEDQIEKSLREIRDKLTAAWRNNRCLTCPLGELAALAAATHEFYVVNRHGQATHDHWSNYVRS